MRAVILVVCALLNWACAAPSLDADRELTADAARLGALAEPGPPRRVILITVAGLQSSDFLDAWGRAAGEDEEVRMPHLARLAQEGSMGIEAMPPSPGATRTSHATLVTGLLPARHGIVSDSTLDGEGSRSLPFLDSRMMKGTPLWDAAIGRGVLSLRWPTTSGARIELVVPEVEVSDSWLDSIRARSSPQIFRELEMIAEEDLEAADDEEGDRNPASWPTPAELDAAIIEVACRVVDSERDPGLWLLRLDQTDGSQRTTGFGSLEDDFALGRIDDGIGTLISCLEAAGQLEETAIFVVGDIAYQGVHSSVAPNVALAEMGLIGRDPRSATGVRSWLALARSHGKSAYVYSRDEANAVEAREVLQQEALRTGAFEIVSAKDLALAGADPQAWFGLISAPGYMIGNELSGDVVRPSSPRGTAGVLQFGNTEEAAVGLVAWGRGIRNRVRLPTVAFVDIAPTIATLLGLRLDDNVEGKPIKSLLRAEVEPPPPGPKRLGADPSEGASEVLRKMRRNREERRGQ